MPRAVLDPGVLLAALISPRGAQAALYLRWRGGLYEMVVSPCLLGELERVLGRPKFRKYVSGEESSAFVESLWREAVPSPDPPPQPGALLGPPGGKVRSELRRASRSERTGPSHP